MAGTKNRRPPDAATTVIEHPGASTSSSRATELPEIAIPPHAARILETEQTPDHDTSPRIGGYALVARFPSSASADVFMGYKVTEFGFLRRAVVKWVDGRRPDYALAHRALTDEARALAGLDHPNVVTVFDYDHSPQGTHLAVEYVAGSDLRRCLAALARRQRFLPWPLAMFVAAEVLRALDHVHDAKDASGMHLGIIHRDVNPSNVLLGEDGRVKITDFGTVRMEGRTQPPTSPGMVKGKVRYLAPEYISEQRCTRQVDIYGVGVMLYEMLAGRPSFEGTSNVEVMISIVRTGLDYALLESNGVPAALIDVVRHATQRTPRHRYADAAQMLDALEDCATRLSAFSSPTRLGRHLSAHDLLC